MDGLSLQALARSYRARTWGMEWEQGKAIWNGNGLPGKGQNSRKQVKNIKKQRFWVEVGPNRVWTGAIDVKKYFLAIPHHENSQKQCFRVILKDFVFLKKLFFFCLPQSKQKPPYINILLFHISLRDEGNTKALNCLTPGPGGIFIIS